MGNQSLRSNQRERVHILEAEREGESPIYRSALSDDLVSIYKEGVNTVYDVMMDSVDKYGDNPCLGMRYNDGPFEWITYGQVYERATNFGSGLRNLGLIPRESNVGLYMTNCIHWVLTEWACNSHSLALVPLYDTLGPDACTFIITQAEITTCVCSADHTLALLQEDNALQTIIQVGPIEEEAAALAAEKNIRLITFGEVEQDGEKNRVDVVPPEPEDVATICYTSGTTGNPKGVLLSHKNFVSVVAGVKLQGVDLYPDDVHISYLPLAHVFERIVLLTVLSSGASAGFFRGSVLTLFDDIQELRPTLFPSVPRLFNRLHDKVLAKARQGGISETIFNTALEAKLDNLKDGYVGHTVWDKLVFGKVAKQLGGRVRLMMTGSAPISSDVISFLRVALSCPVLEGYGQTESTGASTVTMLGDTTPGHVGVPLPCCEVKLVDVPDMNYLSTDPNPRGEICFRGPSCSVGYFKSPEKTAELIDDLGWIHSGDIGEWLPEGTLKIIDRKKNIFKLAQGEYVAPEKLENIYVKSPYVAQMFVYGDSLKSKLVAIVVPDEEYLQQWADFNAVEPNMEELCHNQDLFNAIKMSINEQGDKAEVRGFERIADFKMVTEPFSLENDLLTPTFKLKRPQAKDYFQELLDEMYVNID
eukprot:TRINITY_DN366_c0_g1_i1.p1 TRINITY_DN366_c0_g1~~TRINITY_DN366_c0_g1_i1.p1  ORF type:complete len:645 (+),score=165.86 TRINITY_DN366_c0_g1_i1:1383-3317(+)